MENFHKHFMLTLNMIMFVDNLCCELFYIRHLRNLRTFEAYEIIELSLGEKYWWINRKKCFMFVAIIFHTKKIHLRLETWKLMMP